MKKTFLSVILALLLSFTVGCSCSETPELGFTNLWKGETEGYKETLEYSVRYSSDYAEYGVSFVKSDALSALNADISGTYTVVNEILSKANAEIPAEVKNNEIFKIQTADGTVVKSVTELNLHAEYSLGDKTVTSDDVISTTAYFYNTPFFSPIYTEREFSYTMISVAKNELASGILVGKDSVEYSKDKYKIIKQYRNAADAETETDEKEYKYEYRTLIDNAALFLALRNKNIQKDATYNLPTVHPSYGEKQILALKHFADVEKEITFNFNGEDKTVKFSANGVSFSVNSANSSGTPQVTFIQSAAKDGVDKSLLIEYVEPIVEYGSFARLGALVYTLSQATYS